MVTVEQGSYLFRIKTSDLQANNAMVLQYSIYNIKSTI